MILALGKGCDRLNTGACLTFQHAALQQRQHSRGRSSRQQAVVPVCCTTGDAPASDSLGATIRRKSQQLKARLDELGTESLEEQLQTAVESQEQRAAIPDFRLTRLISDVRAQQGRPVVVAEVRRGLGVATPQQLAQAAQALLAAGADAIAVPTDSEATPSGLADLFAVCQAVQAPVLARDWFLHPLQIVDAREAGAAGVLGVINSVTGNGTGVLSSFAAALGLEAPVEIVNQQESDAVEELGIPFVAVNIAVGLSLSMPSIAAQIAEALVLDQPFGNLSLVGVRSLQDVRRVQKAGADAIFLRADFVEQNVAELSRVWTEESSQTREQAVLEEVEWILLGEE